MPEYRGVEIREDLKVLLEEVPLTLTGLKADIILPTIKVNETSGSIITLPAGVGHKLTDNTRAEDGTYSRTSYKLGKSTYSTDVYGAEESVDNIGKLALESILNEEEVASAITRNRLLLGREKRVADSIMNTTTFAGVDYSKTVGKAWTDPTSDFREDIWTAHEKVRNHLTLGLDQLDLILTSDRVRDMINTLAGKENIKYVNALDLQNPATRLSALVQYIGVKSIVVVDAMTDKAGSNLKGNFDYLWDNSMAMLAALSPTMESWKTGGLGRQAVFSKLTDDYMIESYDEPSRDKRVIRAKEQRGEKVFRDYGFLIKGIA